MTREILRSKKENLIVDVSDDDDPTPDLSPAPAHVSRDASRSMWSPSWTQDEARSGETEAITLNFSEIESDMALPGNNSVSNVYPQQHVAKAVGLDDPGSQQFSAASIDYRAGDIVDCDVDGVIIERVKILRAAHISGEEVYEIQTSSGDLYGVSANEVLGLSPSGARQEPNLPAPLGVNVVRGGQPPRESVTRGRGRGRGRARGPAGAQSRSARSNDPGGCSGGDRGVATPVIPASPNNTLAGAQSETGVPGEPNRGVHTKAEVHSALASSPLASKYRSAGAAGKCGYDRHLAQFPGDIEGAREMNKIYTRQWKDAQQVVWVTGDSISRDEEIAIKENFLIRI